MCCRCVARVLAVILSICCGVCVFCVCILYFLCFGVASCWGSPFPIGKRGGGGALLPFSTQKLKKVIEKVAKRVDKCGAGVVEWVVKGGGGRLCLPARDIYIEVVRYIIIV